MANAASASGPILAAWAGGSVTQRSTTARQLTETPNRLGSRSNGSFGHTGPPLLNLLFSSRRASEGCKTAAATEPLYVLGSFGPLHFVLLGRTRPMTLRRASLCPCLLRTLLCPQRRRWSQPLLYEGAKVARLMSRCYYMKLPSSLK